MTTIYTSAEPLTTAFAAVLEADSTLSTLFPGGVFDSSDFDFSDAQWQWATEKGLVAANGVTLIPHLKIRWRDSEGYQTELAKLGAELESVEIYLHDNGNFTNINQGITRLKTLLHDSLFYPSDRAGCHLLMTFVSAEMPAVDYAQRPMRFVRFTNRHIRS